MARYASDEYEDLDEYEEDGEEEAEGYEEEHEQEEAHEPSPEELEYLELRQQLKERIRKKMKKELGTGTSSRTSSSNIKSSSSKDNFGSFFGPSQPVIAQRVIQESRSLLENPDLAAKVMRSNNTNGKVHASSSVRPKSSTSTSSHAPKVSNGVKSKIQVLKNTRDYSFLLSDDAEVPAPSKPSLPKKPYAPNSDSRSAQISPRDRNPSSSVGRKLPNSYEERKSLPGVGHLKPKPAIQRSVSAGKQNQPAREPKKEPIRSNGSGRGPPVPQKNLPLKSSTGVTERKGSTLDVKRPMPNLPRSNPSKLQPSVSKQALVQKRVSQESSRQKITQKPTVPSSRPPMVTQKHAVPSKPQVVMQKRVLPSSRPPQIKQPPVKNSTQQRPVKRPQRWDDEEEDGVAAISMIRRMFGYNPNKYRNDDDDVSDMEAGFDDILREERHSSKVARKEDEEELRKIEEEERKERLRKAKKRKIER